MSRDATQVVRHHVRSLPLPRGEDGGRAFIAIAGGSFAVVGAQMIYPVLLPHLRVQYGLSLTAAGLLFTTLWVTIALGQLPGGLLADRIGEGRVLLASLVVSAAAFALLVAALSTPFLFAATVLVGVGNALYGVARYTALHDLYPDNVGVVTGLALAAADAGQGLLPPLAGAIAAVVAWQFGFAVTIPLFLIVALGVAHAVPAATSPPAAAPEALSRETLATLLATLRRPAIAYGTAVYTVYGTVWATFTSFYPTYLIEVKGLAPGLASALFGAFFLSGVVVKPLAGLGHDRIGATRALLVVAVVSGTALALLPGLEGPIALVLVTVLVAPLLGSGTITLAYVLGSLPADVRGTGVGVLRTVALLFTAASPSVFGAIADRGYFDEGFLLLAGAAGVMAALALRLPSR